MATKTPLPALAQLQTALTRCYAKISEVLTTATSAITEVSNAKADKSHGHSAITTVGDKRSVATTPNDYKNNLIFQGLKTNSTIGSPSGDSYSYLVGLRGWNDSSGGNSHEVAFNNNGVYTRSGASTWGSWAKLLTSLNYKDIVKPADIGAATANHTHDYAAKVDPKTLTIPATGWGTDTSVTGYTKYIDVSISGLTAADTVCVIIADTSSSVADAACLCGEGQSSAGKFRIRARNIPTAAMTATYYIVR